MSSELTWKKNSSRYPSRGCRAKSGLYAGQDDEDKVPKQDQEVFELEESDPSSSDDLGEDEADFERMKMRRRLGGKVVNKKAKVRRTSSRSNKFQKSMAEPRISELLVPPTREEVKRTTKGRTGKSKKDSPSTRTSPYARQETTNEDESVVTDCHNSESLEGSKESDHHSRRSSSRKLVETQSGSTDSTDLHETDESSVEDDDDEEPLSMQRIIASKSEKCGIWREICRTMNTIEVDAGSVWHQEDKTDDEEFEERFLVKWSDRSYLHCSWETAKDLEDQIENSKAYLNTFFRKSKDGFLFTSEERSDGDYFDPAFTQIERILEIEETCGCDNISPIQEDELTTDDLGIVTDKESPRFEDGLGRYFLVKWGNLSYSNATYEYERDLILNNVDYKQQLKAFHARSAKPTKKLLRSRQRGGEATRRKLYKTFGDNSSMDEEARSSAVAGYQKMLREKVFKNGGQLRDYQAEGVSWMISNYVNKRSCILAGKFDGPKHGWLT